MSSNRALELARRFSEANDEVIVFTRDLTDDEWRMPCEREGRTVGQVVQHIAAGDRIIAGIVEAMAQGRELPVAARRTAAEGARYNERQAFRFADRSRDDGLRLLRRNGAATDRLIASLTDDQLDRSIPTIEGPLTTAEEIEGGLLGHLAAIDDDARRVVEAHDAGRRAALRVMIDRLAGEGLLRTGVNPAHATDVLWLLSSFEAFDQLRHRSSLSLRATTRTLIELSQAIIHPAT